MSSPNRAILEKEGKYLTFALVDEEYGLEILKVCEIIGYMDMTAVPQHGQVHHQRLHALGRGDYR
ncbi:MAG: hypothetical protein ACYSYV_03235 [Planctomycetota bacterium]